MTHSHLFETDQIFKIDNHIQLSNFAAKYYDDEYIMDPEIIRVTRFEERMIQAHALSHGKNDIAIELGCGTGKKSLLISQFYEKVYAYDISKNMLELAKSRKSSNNIVYELLDINKDYEFINHNFSFLFAGFGFASFLTQLQLTLNHFLKVMKNGGAAFFSFYNKLYKLERKSFNGNSIIETDHITVQIKNRIFKIKADTYTVEEVRKIFLGFSLFKILSIQTYPHLILDENNEDVEAGKYIGVIVQKENL